jgi:hypothetical protein
MKKEVCYWCGRRATSMEHVPPKCLFPEHKDISNTYNNNFRKNLITVPSCDDHNLIKSNDDEYLLVCLAGKVGNNGVAFVHNATKVRRARDRNPKIIDVISEDTLSSNDNIYPVQWVSVDNERLIRSFEAIGRALYYHENGITFKGDIKVYSSMFVNLIAEDANEWNEFNHRA